jgi:hypothetical protein
MTSKFVFRSGVLLILLVNACLLVSAAMAENKLDEHRRNSSQARNQSEPTGAAGQIAHFDQNSIATTISLAQLERAGIGDHDRVNAAIGGKTLSARVVQHEAYLKLKEDPRASRMLDVDVLCVLDGTSPSSVVTLVGLGGGLGDWLKPSIGNAVTLTQPR